MAGNWKMYKTAAETTQFFENFLPLVAAAQHCEIVICPVYVNLPAAVEAAKGSNAAIGAQDLYWEKEGAYTGEVSGPMLKAVGATHVIVGHSERRQYFGETNEWVLRKTVAALEAGLTPIVCVGEMLEQREAGKTASVLKEQFDQGIAGLTRRAVREDCDRLRAGMGDRDGEDGHAGDRRGCAPGDPRTGEGAVRTAGCRCGADPVRRQRETGQREEFDGAARDRWRAGGRGEPEAGVVRGDREFLAARHLPRVSAETAVRPEQNTVAHGPLRGCSIGLGCRAIRRPRRRVELPPERIEALAASAAAVRLDSHNAEEPVQQARLGWPHLLKSALRTKESNRFHQYF